MKYTITIMQIDGTQTTFSQATDFAETPDGWLTFLHQGTAWKINKANLLGYGVQNS